MYTKERLYVVIDGLLNLVCLYVDDYIAYWGVFLASVASTAQVSQVINATVCTLLTVFSGFTRQPAHIPVYWKFLYW